jgi:phosphonate transport system substrate-binding protein
MNEVSSFLSCPASPVCAHYFIKGVARSYLASSKIIKSFLAAAIALLSASLALAQPILRVSAIPDESPTELQRKFKPLGDYLEKKLDMKVEFTPVSDYAASVEGLINNKLDMVWFGGFTFVQAKVRSNNQVIPLVQRAEDERIKSVFITTRNDITSLQDLKGKTFTFGSESSTSGHLMPRSYLLAAHITPETDMKRIAFSGAHDATIAAVAGGKVDAGALNISVWEKLVAAGKVDTNVVHVFYTTPGYYDYNWTVRADMDPALREKISKAFFALDKNNAQDKKILDLQRATRFIPTKADNYKAIEAAARHAGLLK